MAKVDVCVGCGTEEPMGTVRDDGQGYVLCTDCGDGLLEWWDEDVVGGDFMDETLKARRAPETADDDDVLGGDGNYRKWEGRELGE